MRGKNTDTLTYRGMDEKERAQTRKAAGCVPGFCAKQIAAGLVPETFNSCDEYPPASSLEGGQPIDEIHRTANCIPDRQNSHQGGKLSSLGKNLKRGDKFVISVDCDKVLGARSKRALAHESEHVQVMEDAEARSDVGVILNARDDDKVSKSGNETVDHGVFDDESGEKQSFLLAPFGDLDPGNYTVQINIVNGSTLGGYILDNGGLNYTSNDTGISSGSSQNYSFFLEDWTSGLGLFIKTASNKTRINWSLGGIIAQPDTTNSSTAVPSATASPTSSAERPMIYLYTTVLTCLFFGQFLL